ncbi:hypothetical protein ACHAXH_002083 [Discostella pseudostelligera]
MTTNVYASTKVTGIGIGHEWQPCTWMAIPIRHGALDSTPATLRYRFMRNDARFDSIANCMTESW